MEFPGWIGFLRLVRHPVRFIISALRSTLLSVFDDVIISFRWICAQLPLLRRICQSEKTRSASQTLDRCLRPWLTSSCANLRHL